jgi:hypothetical protein
MEDKGGRSCAKTSLSLLICRVIQLVMLAQVPSLSCLLTFHIFCCKFHSFQTLGMTRWSIFCIVHFVHFGRDCIGLFLMNSCYSQIKKRNKKLKTEYSHARFILGILPMSPLRLSIQRSLLVAYFAHWSWLQACFEFFDVQTKLRDGELCLTYK